MSSYLLLRNNKESGPYSTEDLVRIGLKPYDLVWLQGKSAAWRYPSEIEELKPYAPVTEEQPYDRFYKKPGAVEKQLLPEEKKPEPVAVPPVKPEYEKYLPKKSVHVSMPGQKPAPVKPIAREEITVVASSPPIPQPTTPVSEEAIIPEVKYSQPLDDIKEMYVKTLHDRKQKIARKGFWIQFAKKAAIVIFFIATGLFAGFMLKSSGNKKKILAEAMISPVPSPSPADSSLNTGAAPDSLLSNMIVLQPPSGGFVNDEMPKEEKPNDDKGANETSLSQLKKNREQTTTSPEEINKTFVAPREVETNPATGERSRQVRNENDVKTATGTRAEDKSSVGGELSGLVSVSSNDYKKVPFGGIRNLELTVSNESKYLLDNVTVELQYLKPSEQPLRTEHIQFSAVGPKATSTIKIPDTNRGIKVVFRITDIKKRAMDEVASGR